MTPTQQARIDVLAADGGCVALVVDPDAGPCRGGTGYAVMGRMVIGCEVDRVRDAPTMGKAPSHTDRTRMVSLCPGHHRGVGAQGGHVWATAHRDLLRRYLGERNVRMGWVAACPIHSNVHPIGSCHDDHPHAAQGSDGRPNAAGGEG